METSLKLKLLFVLGLLLIVYVSAINMFPQGYVFSGNDVVQFINLKNTYGNLFYVWNQFSGTGQFLQYFSYSLFYYPFYLLSELSVSASAQSFLYYFIFLAASYVSFFFASKKFIKPQFNHSFELRLLFSLIYTFNPYTLYVFTYTWGYSPFLFLYPLIPAIFSLTYTYFSSQNVLSRTLPALGVVFFAANIAFGNFSFYVALNLFLLAFIVLLYIFRLASGKIIPKFFAFFFVMAVSTFWILFTDIVGMIYTYSAMMGSSAFDLGSWILYQRLSLLPQIFLYPNLDYFIGAFPLFFVLGVAGFIGLLATSLLKIKKLSVIFVVLTAISIFITSKGAGLLSDGIALNLFTLPILNTLRSYDKTFIFLPFFLFMIIFLGIQEFYSRNPVAFKRVNFGKLNLHLSHRRLVLVAFVLIMVWVTPFFMGGIQTRYSYIIDPGSDYQSSTYSYLVKIPDDYYNASNLLSEDLRQNKILDLPYSVLNSVGWVNYPKWQLVSADPTEQLFSKTRVQSNGAYFYQYSQHWSTMNTTEAKWIVNLMSLYNVQYLIYHKDVDEKFINQTQEKIMYLQNESYITLMANYTNFDLYQLNSTYYRPSIYPSTSSTFVNGSTSQLVDALREVSLTDNTIFFLTWQISPQQQLTANINQTATPKITFQQDNLSKYQVKVENATSPFFLVFSESYDPWWKAYVENSPATFGDVVGSYENFGVEETYCNQSGLVDNMNYLLGEPLPENTHYMVNGYANAWFIDPETIPKNADGSFEITLYYVPQSYYEVGFIVSSVTAVTCIVLVAAQTFVPKIGFSVRNRKNRAA
ncbi:MAG: hypothetical protein NWF01_12140 [Candidatus Bathyarchaeota archaeon]|nr:hypothetical protein [Candidatus Bathyarchaeota archaeon]